jgi:hypothetical protein
MSLAQLLEPGLPAFGGRPQALENRGHLMRDRRLPQAVQPTRVIDQKQVIAQRETLDHPLTRRAQRPPVLDRAQPEGLVQTRVGGAGWIVGYLEIRDEKVEIRKKIKRNADQLPIH